MTTRPNDPDTMPAEIDFSQGSRGLHHIPANAKVSLPTSEGERKTIGMADLLKRDK